jgi:ribosome maturation protein SDO1
LSLRKGSDVDFGELLAATTVFKDAAKGSAQSPEVLSKVFGTTDIGVIAKRIVLQGEVQLTTEQRKAMREARKREVIEFISRNAMNPQTNSPHPPQRIEIALEEAKIHIDEFKSAEEQANEILKELKKIIPISFEKLKIAVSRIGCAAFFAMRRSRSEDTLIFTFSLLLFNFYGTSTSSNTRLTMSSDVLSSASAS